MDALPTFLREGPSNEAPFAASRTVRIPILERGVHHLAELVQDSYIQWECSRRDGLVQRLDPRLKVAFLAIFLVAISLKRTVAPQIVTFLGIVALMAASRLDLGFVLRRVAWAAFLFGVLIPLPSLLNLFGNGTVLLPLLTLSHDCQIWHYHIPATIGITTEGVRGMALLTLRIGNSLALSLLVLHTTSFPDLIKALRLFRVPDSFIVVITLSYKYVFAFSRIIIEMHLAKKSRLLGGMDAVQSRYWAAGRIAALFHKTQRRCEEICKAMVARGLEHSIMLHAFPALNGHDYGAAGIALLLCAGLLAW